MEVRLREKAAHRGTQRTSSLESTGHTGLGRQAPTLNEKDAGVLPQSPPGHLSTWCKGIGYKYENGAQFPRNFRFFPSFLNLPRKLQGMVFLWGRHLRQFSNFFSHSHRITISCSFLLPLISPLCHPSLPFLLYYWFRLNVNWQSFTCDNCTLSLSR